MALYQLAEPRCPPPRLPERHRKAAFQSRVRGNTLAWLPLSRWRLAASVAVVKALLTPLAVLAPWALPLTIGIAVARGGAVSDKSMSSGTSIRVELFVKKGSWTGNQLRFPTVPGDQWRDLWLSRSGRYVFTFDVSSSIVPDTLEIRALGPVGLLLTDVTLNGAQVKSKLPRWIDKPCALTKSEIFVCCTVCRWTIEPDVTTVTLTSTSTTFTSTTVTSSSTTASSTSTTLAVVTSSTTPSTTTSTATSTTLSTTTSTTTSSTSSTTTSRKNESFLEWSSMEAREVEDFSFPGLEQATEAATPNAFYSEFGATLSLDTNGDLSLSDGESEKYQKEIAARLADYLNVTPPSVRVLSMRPTSEETPHILALELTIRVPDYDNVNVNDAEAVRNFLSDDKHLQNLNAVFSSIGLGNETHASSFGCAPGALFCCIGVVVSEVLVNAGVVEPYKNYFALSIVLVFILALTAGTAPRGGADVVTRRLFFVGTAFQATFLSLKSVSKYEMVRNHCAHGERDLVCPPSPWPCVFEVLVFGVLYEAAALYFLRWWSLRAASATFMKRANVEVEHAGDEAMTASPSLLGDDQRHRSPELPVAPVESLLRRNPLFSCWHVRHSDLVPPSAHKLLLATNFLISCAVVNVSFFALQRYRMPGLFTAWYPYKMIFEMFILTGATGSLRVIVLSNMFGVHTRSFLKLAAVLALAVNVTLWTFIVRTMLVLASTHNNLSFSLEKTLAILDIALGAGLAQFLIPPLTGTLALHAISAYAYEPMFRHKRNRCVYVSLESPRQIREVASLLSHNGGDWELAAPTCALKGRKRHAIHIPELHTEADITDEDDMIEDPKEDASSSTSSEHDDGSDSDDGCRGSSSGSMVVVKLQRANVEPRLRHLMSLLDMALGVQTELPVMPAAKLPRERHSEHRAAALVEQGLLKTNLHQLHPSSLKDRR
eukprot:TRINITY_DN28192_c0_g2_i1.p1 TRINITY_DN28192_c0_g2~~TRINITY_DN28192_c0_g2_i1.p1  ORF type:complete len:941 (-),score=150.22 TRINITY_DN28192_c0_g2_i1:110-2932(-)